MLYSQEMSVRLLAGAGLVAAATIGCQSAERQAAEPIARSGGIEVEVPSVHEGDDESDYYVPPAIDDARPLRNAPPAPVPPAINDVTWSMDDSDAGTLKPVSSAYEANVPKLLSPGRARSVRDWVMGRDTNAR